MAAPATRSASGGASSSSDDESRCLMLALSHDELGVIVDGLADPLQPAVAVALSSTCLGLRTPLRVVLEVLKERHERALALCRKVGINVRVYLTPWKRGTSCRELRAATELYWWQKGLDTNDMAVLGMILRFLPSLQSLEISNNPVGDTGMHAMCEGLGFGAAPSLSDLSLAGNKFGPAGAEVLAAALRRGAMPKLKELQICSNAIGSQGVAALAAPLRKMPALKRLFLDSCDTGDEGVASLVDNLGKDDFKELEMLGLLEDNITDAGCATLASSLDAGGMPMIDHIVVASPGKSVVRAALERRAREGTAQCMKSRNFHKHSCLCREISNHSHANT